ncbi:segregation and condensation protein A [Baia soyae]|uniref:segregation and condensation protein A n=1 Tax=Baia soyae TaxID=1544746 RepID=UPI0010529165|nr:segregation/condensation protein A [Baia soyae]
MEVKFKLNSFEGPLDLLLHLIDQSEVDIYEVPISQITDQYMNMIQEANHYEIEVASEFIVMAATLLAIKSRMLLPKQEIFEEAHSFMDDEWMDPREELVEKLLEYKRYKRLGEMLREQEEERSQVYTRVPADLSPFAPVENPVAGLTTDDLLQAFVLALQTHPPKNEPMTRLAREEISVSDRMEEIVQELAIQGRILFTSLLDWTKMSKERVITTFLALLELMKTKRIKCSQYDLFTDILIEPFVQEVAP